MNRLALLLGCVLLPLVARAELPRPDRPGEQPAWRELFAALSADVPRLSRFEERRTFRSRPRPVVLTGEIRHAPGHGISVHYLTPQVQTLIIDDRGILQRDARGRTRALPAQGPAAAATDVLRGVLRFDLGALEQQFVVHGAREGRDWILKLLPRETADATALASITLSGQSTRLERIEILRPAEQRIEILIRDTHEGVAFTAAELQRFFRSP